MKVVKVVEMIALSALLVGTVIGAALAQERMTTRLYGPGEEARQVDLQAKQGEMGRWEEAERQVGELNDAQFAEVIDFAERLLRLQSGDQPSHASARPQMD